MTEKLITVAVFGSPHEAGMAKGKLESFGIPAFVADEFTIGANPFYSNALGGVKVQVPASHAEEALKVLSAVSPPGPEDEERTEQQSDPRKLMAKSFVWLYLLMAGAMAAVVVYLFMKL